ncbi:MAG TPA: ribosomal biogenesis protein [Methanothermococcus okinawensis]|uniref:Probable Brix domain-containing ribosomal biogenesis protein n=1 Tax=Methanothermococcus okinawensis TaxID=155863 RepID=A0A832ZCZ7_9EURY|nr:ribosomal biogenesis protein [Methanothermococcus okinawensis]HIP91438.1 ribosomal biogenesis protein [Methanothermococcus okinawensis]
MEMEVIITTSRKPSQRTRSFVKDLARVLGGKSLTRGKTPLKEILSKYPKVILVEEYRGNPGKLKLYDVREEKLILLFISVKLQREICNKNVENREGKIKMEFYGDTVTYKDLFYNFFRDFNIISQDSPFRMCFEESSKDSEVLFYIQFYRGEEKIGPLIAVKDLKVLEIAD